MPCFRTNGVVPIPKKIVRKTSLPVITKKPPFQRKVSCPILKTAEELFITEETVEDLTKVQLLSPEYEVQTNPASGKNKNPIFLQT